MSQCIRESSRGVYENLVSQREQTGAPYSDDKMILQYHDQLVPGEQQPNVTVWPRSLELFTAHSESSQCDEAATCQQPCRPTYPLTLDSPCGMTTNSSWFKNVTFNDLQHWTPATQSDFKRITDGLSSTMTPCAFMENSLDSPTQRVRFSYQTQPEKSKLVWMNLTIIYALSREMTVKIIVHLP